MKAAAGIYARISSDDGSALGVQRQIADCKREVERRGWTLAETFVDNDVSASTGKARPAFEGMVAAIRAGRIGAVCVWDVDRLTRTPRELEDFIALADTHGLRLASVGGEIDLGTEQGRLTARLKGSVARYEVEQSSRRLRAKFLERAQDGKPHGKAAYGWQRVEGADVVDADEAAVIREVARRLLARESSRSIWRDLNARSVPAPRGRQWDGVILRQVMLRERNAARRVHRGQVIGKGAWEPILDEDTHDRVTALLRDPGRVTARGTPLRYLLSGLARCGPCGAAMRVLTSGGRQAPAYGCRECFRVRRKVASVDEVVETVVVGRLSMPDGPNLLGGDAQEMAKAEDELDALRSRLESAADQYADGAITGAQLERITTRLRPKIEDAERRVRASAPVPEFAAFGGAGAAQAWARAGLETKRAIIAQLLEVTILPAGAGRGFDPATVKVEWRRDDG